MAWRTERGGRRWGVRPAVCLGGALLSFAYAPMAQAGDAPASGRRWVGLCVKIDASRHVSDAVVGGSSGDPAFDKLMLDEVISMPSPGHAPVGKWTPLRVAPDGASGEDQADDDQPFFDCDKLNAPPPVAK